MKSLDDFWCPISKDCTCCAGYKGKCNCVSSQKLASCQICLELYQTNAPTPTPATTSSTTTAPAPAPATTTSTSVPPGPPPGPSPLAVAAAPAAAAPLKVNTF